MDLVWQESLFDAPARPSLSFEGLVHDQLDATSWIDVVPGWLPGHQELFDRLAREAPWQQRSRRMWDTEVLEPRLVAGFPMPLPDDLELLRAAVSEQYGVEFDSCLVNLYRDGNDAVAWHGDTVRKVLAQPLVVTVSLGAHRRFVVRRRGGEVVREYAPGAGDLVVMGGRVQHDYEHAVPRDKRASGARMSVTIRHSRAAT